MYSSPTARNQEIDFGATLIPIALRNLVDHAAIHLNVEWRDLPQEKWANQVKTAQGRTVPDSETVWMRTREVWLHAVDLDNGATISDIPAPILERLLGDITSAWRTRGTDAGLIIEVEGNATRLGDIANPDAVLVTDPLADITAWAAGRGTIANAPAAPAWI